MLTIENGKTAIDPARNSDRARPRWNSRHIDNLGIDSASVVHKRASVGYHNPTDLRVSNPIRGVPALRTPKRPWGPFGFRAKDQVGPRPSPNARNARFFVGGRGLLKVSYWRAIRRASPLFLILFISAIISFGTFPLAHASPFVSETHITACAGPTCNSSSYTVTAGNVVIADCYALFNNACTISDSLSNTWTLREDANSAGNNRQSLYTATISATGSDIVSSSSSGVIQLEIVQYTGITAIGTNGFDNAFNRPSSYSSTVTLTTSKAAVIYEGWAVLNGAGGGGACAGLSSITGSPIFNMPCFDCIVSCGSDKGMNALSAQIFLTGGPGTFPNTVSWVGAANADNQQVHFALELDLANAILITAASQCYGNCGSPAVTYANTNSTHSINFNNSVTLFYEAQSNLNGIVSNVTLNIAKTYTNGENLVLGLYSVDPSCNGAPFTPTCPAFLQTSSKFTNPSKGPISMPTSFQIQIGEWIGISVTAAFTGLDVNDTNTSVALNQIQGRTPGTIFSPSSAGSSKIGLYAWITGFSVIVPGGGGANSGSCNIACDLIAFVTALGGGTVGGIAAFGILFGLISGTLLYATRQHDAQGHIRGFAIPMELLLVFAVLLIIAMSAAGALPPYIPLIIIAISAWLLTSSIWSKRRSSQTGEGTM